LCEGRSRAARVRRAPRSGGPRGGHGCRPSLPDAAAAIDVVEPEHELPKLPVARALWKPTPDLPTSAAAWIYAGCSHHTALGYSVTSEHLSDFAAMSGVEFLMIDEETRVDAFRERLRWNDLYYHLARGL